MTALKSVERIALGNGYDSFIMFNVYAQRATKPDDMDDELNDALHRENMKAFEYILSLYEKEKPFIILDDPFTAFDDHKTSAALKTLKEFSKERQVIYFTCSKSRSV